MTSVERQDQEARRWWDELSDEEQDGVVAWVYHKVHEEDAEPRLAATPMLPSRRDGLNMWQFFLSTCAEQLTANSRMEIGGDTLLPLLVGALTPREARTSSLRTALSDGRARHAA